MSAVYNVDRYLPDFFASLERQIYGIENLDVILIDDGSTDASLQSCQAFAAKHPHSVRVLGKSNGGQGSARNLGLEHVCGDWVTFTDPDDFLDDRYFAEIASFLDAAIDAPQVVSTSLLTYVESTGKREHSHPLQRKFDRGNRVIDLTAEPECIQMHCSSSIVDARLLRSHRLRFDERIRPSFEDAHFVARCLLSAKQPRLGAVASAEYNYRKRSDASSTIDASAANPDKYTAVPRYGLLGLLSDARATDGRVPAWVQNVVVYDLAWAFKDDCAVSSKTGSLTEAVTAEFHELAALILRQIDRRVLEQFSLHRLNDDVRFALTQGYVGGNAQSDSVDVRAFDEAQSLVKLSYRYVGEAPSEAVLVDGHPANPFLAKSRSIEFFGRAIAFERILWVQLGGDVRIVLNGEPTPIFDESNQDVSQGFPLAVRRERDSRLSTTPEPFREPARSNWHRLRHRTGLFPHSLRRAAITESLLGFALHSRAIRSRFGSAWVFMDKDVLAGDNAEHLYRHARDQHPELNCWFVLNRNSPDWDRLRHDGFRLVAYGSLHWKLLLLSADVLASSHIDSYVVRPLSVKRYGEPRWKYVFLQHGVIQSDLSRWLNAKLVDLFITSSTAEHESIVADLTPYAFTSKEVKLLGLPRHDALVNKRKMLAPSARNLLVVMPTWRKGLLSESAGVANNRHTIGNFAQTEYAQQWLGLVESERLREVARHHGLSIAFMPHPNMAAYLAEISLPADVEVFSYREHDVQEVLARSQLLVTDYSSIAFDAASISVPVIYFQFDAEAFHSGGHIARSGYFDYERDGFGPVGLTPEKVVSDAEEILRDGVDSVYVGRAHRTFAHHDDKNSERVLLAMRNMSANALSPLHPESTATR